MSTFTVMRPQRFLKWMGISTIHNSEEEARQKKVLRETGLRILRFRNAEIVRELSMIIGKIGELIKK